MLKAYDANKYLGVRTLVISLCVLSISLASDSTIKMTLTVNCVLSQVPLLIIESLAGICIVLSISFLLKKNRLLEYIGRISLIVYLVQWSVMSTFIGHSHLFGHNIVISIFGYILTIALVVVFATVVNKICKSSKYLKFVIGK